MFRLLLRKQLSEVFRSYYYDSKKNKMRSKWAVAAWIAFFVLIMAGMLGGMFSYLALTLCKPLDAVGMGWLYFLLMGILSICLGAFGSVFNTYAGLYLAKDNDLLLSLPIPVRTIIAARLMNVYLLGSMYAATVLLPTLLVYWLVCGATLSRVLCGLLFLLIVTVIVLLLSCVLGWAVAKISLRLKNKSFVTVLISLLFIAAYYFFYFRASLLVRQLVQNAVLYGAKIKGTAYGLYLFGRIGEGDWFAAAVFTAATALLSVLLYRLMARSFLKLATSSGAAAKTRYVEKTAKQRSPFAALMGKELSRFTSNASYMLNCGLGVLLIPLVGVLLLVQGRTVFRVLDEVFYARPGVSAVLLCVTLSLLSSLINMAAPSVSLEGKSLWLPQSLPVEAKTVLRAKLSVALLLTLPPMLFASVCALFSIDCAPGVKLLLLLTPQSYACFTTLGDMFLGVKLPLLNWTDETAPIKRSGAIAISIFGGWGLTLLFGGLYMLVGYRLGAGLYLLLWTLLFTALSFLLLRWLDTRGAKAFLEL